MCCYCITDVHVVIPVCCWVEIKYVGFLVCVHICWMVDFNNYLTGIISSLCDTMRHIWMHHCSVWYGVPYLDASLLCLIPCAIFGCIIALFDTVCHISIDIILNNNNLPECISALYDTMWRIIIEIIVTQWKTNNTTMSEQFQRPTERKITKRMKSDTPALIYLAYHFPGFGTGTSIKR